MTSYACFHNFGHLTFSPKFMIMGFKLFELAILVQFEQLRWTKIANSKSLKHVVIISTEFPTACITSFTYFS